MKSAAFGGAAGKCQLLPSDVYDRFGLMVNFGGVMLVGLCG